MIIGNVLDWIWVELTCTEPDCTYDGEWNFECNGIEYTVFVEVEN